MGLLYDYGMVQRNTYWHAIKLREVRVIWNSLETIDGTDQKTNTTFYWGNNHVDVLSRCLVIDQQIAFRLNWLHIKKNTKEYLLYNFMAV